MRIQLLCIVAILSTNVLGQDVLLLDSLNVQLNYAKQDSNKVKTLWELSDYYWADDLRQAYRYSEEALTLAKELKDDRLIAISYQKVGDALVFRGDKSNALKHYLAGLEIVERLNDETLLFTLYHNMGVLFDRLADYDQALSYYEKALYVYNNAADKSDAMQSVHTLYNSMANIYDEKNDTATAIKYYQKALKLATEKEDYQALGTIYNNLGKVSLEAREWEVAYEYLTNSLKCRQKINDLNGMAKSYNNLATYYLMLNQTDDAYAAARQGLELAHRAGAMLTRLTALQNMSTIYENKGELDLALDTYKQYKALNDSLINESSIKKQTELQIKYEYEKEQKVKEAEQQKRNFRYILVISVLLLGLIISILLYRLTQNRAKRVRLENENLEKDLEMRNQDIVVKDKELASSVLYLLKKNELLNNVSERLLQIKKKMKAENHNAIQKIILDIQEGAKEDMWEEFEIRFQQVHDDYFKKLKEHAPDLTPGEIKICTFLKLNMTSKEISAITRQSVKSIEVARTRIRKKMRLTNKEVNLVNFLMDL
ncbi:tetratricopeptide repeat protein [Carboxylicivirga mesophila]|uniref:Tetratricopeptide repeat protein n=1 Tax=Carboxylicivirga mesophila TaxID=1166478 RepID=A0ABS5K5B4_9BACT|nr:tetratricopeptide repeat protein [Carboxylicivirga mesophila]MBS2210163.1 tetratricopeptide repeat protein [Carboxylicivirga mesophila]